MLFLGMAKDSRRRLFVDVSAEMREILGAVAYKRARKDGGRVSAAKVISDELEGLKEKLRKEAGSLLK